MKVYCPSVHTTQAYRLVEGDRILLKDLRVLNVKAVRPGAEPNHLRILWYQEASKTNGELDVPRRQLLKIICGERGCSVGREAAELI